MAHEERIIDGARLVLARRYAARRNAEARRTLKIRAVLRRWHSAVVIGSAIFILGETDLYWT